MSMTRLFTNVIHRNFHLARVLFGHTHYDTLKVTQNCTTKEIREAFIKLSKECHPDCNQNDPKNHAMFVKLNEAYSILSRPDKRRDYDESLIFIKQQYQQRYHHHSDSYSSYARVRYDTYNWSAGGKSRTNSHNSQDFYGIRGLKRVSNTTIALLCIAVASVGVILQAIAIRQSLTFSRKRLDEKSHQNGEVLAKVRENAQCYGNEQQLEFLRERVIRSTVDVSPIDFGKEDVAGIDPFSDTVIATVGQATEEVEQMPTGVNKSSYMDHQLRV